MVFVAQLISMDAGVFEDRSYQGIEDVNKVLGWNSGPLEHS